MRRSFRVTIAVVTMHNGQVLRMYIKAVQVKRRSKPYRNTSLMCPCILAFRHNSFDDIPRLEAHVGLLTCLWFGSRKPRIVHQAHLA